MQHSILSFSSKRAMFLAIIIFLGIIVLGLDIFLYSSFLPSTISEVSLKQIEITVFAFYLLYISGLLTISYGTYALMSSLSKETSKSSPKTGTSNNSSITLAPAFLIFRIAVMIITSRRYYRLFWAICIGYGIVYGVVSGLFIFHQKDFAAEYGVSIPSVTSITYGPTGYVPALAIYVTDHLGLFIIPFNLLVILIISALVGFNGILTIYAINQRRQTSSVAKSGSYSLANNFIGAAIGLFAACPTCASFYIFAVLAGSLAPSIAAFTVAFYTLFLGISVPLLIGSSLLTLYAISKMGSAKACKF
jgi:hypothetical protein